MTPPSPSRWACRCGRRNLAVQYAARLPPRSLAFHWPAPPLLLAIQPKLEHDLFLSAARGRDAGGLASPAYQRLFLKTLIEKVGDAMAACAHDDPDGELELDEGIMQRYTALLSSPSSSSSANDLTAGPPPPSTIQYLYPSPSSSSSSSRLAGPSSEAEEDDLLADLNCITLHEAGTMISHGTTGLRTWEASLALASHILASSSSASALTSQDERGGAERSLWRTIVRSGARVLELGSGVGMLGVLCAQLQRDHSAAMGPPSSPSPPAQVFMTDVPGQVLDSLQHTIEQNGLGASRLVHVEPLDWLELSHEAASSPPTPTPTPTPAGPLHTWLRSTARPTLVLAADVVFDPELCGPLVQTLRAALEAGRDAEGEGEGESVAYVASTVRNAQTYAVFLAALERHNLDSVKVELSPQRVSIPPPPRPSSSLSSTSSSGGQDRSAPQEEEEDVLPPVSVPVFPSAHDPSRDGTVELLRIRLRASAPTSTSATAAQAVTPMR
ncbi:hypothetical protein OC842_003154 [Tilletia horrida]|uniref:FAM86 N-terminal domain-containing protein n=1 Tax=Tilletia horrida TaxID=155126 RepID=A0AAN6GC15_9BASI|nr:hypothetical protein OC842_003154 [Tilletia horrida]